MELIKHQNVIDSLYIIEYEYLFWLCCKDFALRNLTLFSFIFKSVKNTQKTIDYERLPSIVVIGSASAADIFPSARDAFASPIDTFPSTTEGLL